MGDVTNILAADEEIQWSDKQKHAVILVHAIIGLIVTWLIGNFLGSQSEIDCTVNGKSTTCNPAKYAVLVYLLGFGSVAWWYFSNRVIVYYITSKRILIKSGLIGKDYKSVYFEQVQSCDVNVGLIDKIFGTGTISIDTGRVNNNRPDLDKLSFISPPYDTYQFLQTRIRAYKENLYK